MTNTGEHAMAVTGAAASRWISDTALAVGVTLYVVAWFVDVAPRDATAMPGWVAFLMASGFADDQNYKAEIWYRLSAATNLVVVSFPFYSHGRRQLPGMGAVALLLSFILNLSWIPWASWEFGTLGPGYYAWANSFWILAVALELRRRSM